MNRKKYIRFGNIPKNEQSGIYKGDNKIGEELGVSVYDTKFIDGSWRVVLPEKLSSKAAHSLYGLLNNVLQDEWEVERPSDVFLVTGEEIGKGRDNEPLIKNVKILNRIKVND